MQFTITAQAGGQFLPYLRRNLRRAIPLLDSLLGEISIALVSNRTMSRLHKTYLAMPGPTDVLSFELERDAGGRVISGEVIVCVPEARRQARRHGTKIEAELLLYALHGILHLAGYDDTTAARYRNMHKMEDDILTRLGIGAVFACRNSPQSRGERRGKPKSR